MTVSTSPARDLAQTLVDRLLAADPFTGTGLGLREYDSLVPDPSERAEDELVADLASIARQAGVVTADGSLSAHFEHTIAVTDDGPEVLTLP